MRQKYRRNEWVQEQKFIYLYRTTNTDTERGWSLTQTPWENTVEAETHLYLKAVNLAISRNNSLNCQRRSLVLACSQSGSNVIIVSYTIYNSFCLQHLVKLCCHVSVLQWEFRQKWIHFILWLLQMRWKFYTSIEGNVCITVWYWWWSIQLLLPQYFQWSYLSVCLCLLLFLLLHAMPQITIPFEHWLHYPPNLSLLHMGGLCPFCKTLSHNRFALKCIPPFLSCAQSFTRG